VRHYTNSTIFSQRKIERTKTRNKNRHDLFSFSSFRVFVVKNSPVGCVQRTTSPPPPFSLVRFTHSTTATRVFN
jgi:hypothetical protein